MENLLQDIASGLWIVLGIQVLVWLKRWNKKFSDLYDELKHETGGVHGRWVPLGIMEREIRRNCEGGVY